MCCWLLLKIYPIDLVLWSRVANTFRQQQKYANTVSDIVPVQLQDYLKACLFICFWSTLPDHSQPMYATSADTSKYTQRHKTIFDH